MQQRILFSLLLLLWSVSSFAQFRDMETLPWCPPRTTAQMGALAQESVLDALNDAFSAGRYQDVVERYFPLAMAQGYQRNANLYNQTRKALRQLMQTESGMDYWEQMQRLYAERYANIGQDEYEYRNSLETRAWCDQQLANEQLHMLLSRPDRYEQCFVQAQRLLQQDQGFADPVWVTQGMFVPINRLHAQDATRGKELLPLYQQVLEWMDATDAYMSLNHPADYRTYYSDQMLASVRNECRRVLEANAAFSDYASRLEQRRLEDEAYNDSVYADVRAQRLYAQAVDMYRRQDYAGAYNAVNAALAADPSREARVLKSNILQQAANHTTSMSDKVAFWCAAYEAGVGYQEARVLSQIVSALDSHLFMSGMAGQLHSTTTPFVIRQRVWTMDQLRSHK